MSDARFPSSGENHVPDHVIVVDIAGGSIDLAELHAHVVTRHARVEFVRGNGDGNDHAACVLISKSELQGLERALEILAATDDVRAMREELARVAARAREPVGIFRDTRSGERGLGM